MLMLFVVASRPASAEEDILAYEYYLNAGVQSFRDHNDEAAIDYLNKAHLINPSAEEPLHYINLIKRVYDGKVQPVLSAAKEPALAGSDERARAIDAAMDQAAVKKQPAVAVTPDKPEEYMPASIPAPVPAAAKKEPLVPVAKSPVPVQPENRKMAPAFVQTSSKGKVDTVTLDDIQNSGQAKPTLNVEMGSVVVIEGRNIRKFLEIDPGFIAISEEGGSRIRIEGKARGSTFLHIWDDRGRTTVFIEVIFPRIPEEQAAQRPVELEHAPPFKMRYALNSSSYYYGPDASGLRRTQHDVQESFALEGETPYGFFDSSVAMTGLMDIDQVSYYTVGLSNIPLKGVNDLDLRLFDAYRFLSPLTMPGTRLQGAFADIRFMDNVLGISASHGQQLSSFNYLAEGSQHARDVFVDAVKVSLFPGNVQHGLVFNFARGYGDEREETLTRQVYSVEGHQKMGGVDLNAELARGDDSMAGNAGLKFATGLFKQSLNFRNIGKEFTTVVTTPSNQGEIGAAWTTSLETDRVAADTFVDVYQDNILPNQDDPQAFNYDTNAHVRVPLADNYRMDTTVRYVYTPGEAFPRRFGSGDVRLTRDFQVWAERRASVYVGAVNQFSRFEYSPESEYDRNALTAGIYLPLINTLTAFINYEYSWLHERFSGDDYHPAVMNTGLQYNKQLTEKLTGNLGVTYRDEQDTTGRNSFLAGEDSVALSAGLNYAPKNDVNLYCDARFRNVLAQVPNNPSYNDLDVRFGMNMAFGLGVSWDPIGTVSGFVYKDLDGNKEFNPNDLGFSGDEGLAGIKVKIGNHETVTDQRGWYSMRVRGKRVTVMPVMESLPPGFIFVTPTAQKVDVFQGRISRVDFGLTTQSGIYGIAFVDNNNNGMPDQNDRFVSRVKVVLDGTASQITDGRGAYFFKNIKQGKHTLVVDMKSLPAEFIPLVKIKNDVDVAEGTTYIFHIPLKVKPETPEL